MSLFDLARLCVVFFLALTRRGGMVWWMRPQTSTQHTGGVYILRVWYERVTIDLGSGHFVDEESGVDIVYHACVSA
jgi:hypothetical protein